MPDRPVLFYDGGCGLCHRAVRFLLRLDREGRLAFAPLGGGTFLASVPAAARAALPDSLVLLTEDGRLSLRWRAVAGALCAIGGAGAWLAAFASLLPPRLGDRLYDLVASRRRRLCAAPIDRCPVPPGRWRARFLP